MRDIYINSNLSPLKKFTSSSRSTEFKDILPWTISKNDHEDSPNQHDNSDKQRDETMHPVVKMMESQWKLRQQHDKIFPMEENSL